MKIYQRIFLCLIFIFTTQAQANNPASQFYKYANNDAEYSIMLPEAPLVKTIWGNSSDIPYLDNPPKDGSLGEIATFRRVDPDTEDSFDVRITFLKADQAFLSNLTEDKMKATLENDFNGIKLDNKQFTFSSGANAVLKWATLTGIDVDNNNHPFYNAEHYLTGQQSITVVKVRYSIENKAFTDDYKNLTANIAYHPL